VNQAAYISREEREDREEVVVAAKPALAVASAVHGFRLARE
jgi:hypothetical protein